MICVFCVGWVEKVLFKVFGVLSVFVNLVIEKVFVWFLVGVLVLVLKEVVCKVGY